MRESRNPLAGLRVFVAEDEFHILQFIEDVLTDLGCAVTDSVSNIRAAVDTAAVTQAQVAVLDVNLGGARIFPAALLLRARRIPIVFSTGYGSGGIDVGWESYPVIQKPFAAEDLEAVLRSVCHASHDSAAGVWHLPIEPT